MTPPDAAKVKLDINECELRALVGAITHWMVYQRPLVRGELERFMFNHEAQSREHSSQYITKLIRRGLLLVVGRCNMGGEHILQHTPRAERLLGVAHQVRQSEQEFWSAIRGEYSGERAA